jgi:hypothetical protein
MKLESILAAGGSRRLMPVQTVGCRPRLGRVAAALRLLGTQFADQQNRNFNCQNWFGTNFANHKKPHIPLFRGVELVCNVRPRGTFRLKCHARKNRFDLLSANNH